MPHFTDGFIGHNVKVVYPLGSKYCVRRQFHRKGQALPSRPPAPRSQSHGQTGPAGQYNFPYNGHYGYSTPQAPMPPYQPYYAFQPAAMHHGNHFQANRYPFRPAGYYPHSMQAGPGIADPPLGYA